MNDFFEKIGVEIPKVETPSFFEDVEKPLYKADDVFVIPDEVKKKYKKVPKPLYSRFTQKIMELAETLVRWDLDQEEDILVFPSELFDLEKAKKFVGTYKDQSMQHMLYSFGMTGSKILEESFSKILLTKDLMSINSINEKALQKMLTLFGNFFYFFNEHKKNELDPLRGLLGTIEDYKSKIDNWTKDLKYVEKTKVYEQKMKQLKEFFERAESLQNDVNEKTKTFKMNALILGTNISFMSIQIGWYDTSLEKIIQDIVSEEKVTTGIGVKLTEDTQRLEKQIQELSPKLYGRRLGEFGQRYVFDTVNALRKFVHFSTKEKYVSVKGIEEVLEVIKDLCKDENESMKDIVNLCTSDDYIVRSEYTLEFHNDVRYVFDTVYTAIRENIFEPFIESFIKRQEDGNPQLYKDMNEYQKLEAEYIGEFDELFHVVIKLTGYPDELFHTQGIIKEEVDRVLKKEEVQSIKSDIVPIGSFLYDNPKTNQNGGITRSGSVHWYINSALSLIDVHNVVYSDKNVFYGSLKNYFWPKGKDDEESWFRSITSRVFGSDWMTSLIAGVTEFMEESSWAAWIFTKLLYAPATIFKYLIAMLSVWNLRTIGPIMGWVQKNLLSKISYVASTFNNIFGFMGIQFAKASMSIIFKLMIKMSVPTFVSLTISIATLKIFQVISDTVEPLFKSLAKILLKLTKKTSLVSPETAELLFFVVLNLFFDTFVNWAIFSSWWMLPAYLTHLFSPMYLSSMWMYISFQKFFDRTRLATIGVITNLLEKWSGGKIKYEGVKNKCLIWFIYVSIRFGALTALNYFIPATRHPLLYDKNLFYAKEDDPNITGPNVETFPELEKELRRRKESKGWIKSFTDVVGLTKEDPLDPKFEEMQKAQMVAIAEQEREKIRITNDKLMEKKQDEKEWNNANIVMKIWKAAFRRREDDKKLYLGNFAGFKLTIKNALLRIVPKYTGFDISKNLLLHNTFDAAYEFLMLSVDNYFDSVTPALINAPNDPQARAFVGMSEPQPPDALNLTAYNVSDKIKKLSEAFKNLEYYIKKAPPGSEFSLVMKTTLRVNKRPTASQVREESQRLSIEPPPQQTVTTDKIGSMISESISKTGVPCSLIDVCNMIDENDCFVNKKQKKEEVKQNWNSLVKSFYNK
jgi:hypothetical protein